MNVALFSLKVWEPSWIGQGSFTLKSNDLKDFNAIEPVSILQMSNAC